MHWVVSGCGEEVADERSPGAGTAGMKLQG